MNVTNHAILQIAVAIHRIALQLVTEVIHHKAFLIGTEIAGAGIADIAIVAGNKEAIAVNGQIQTVLRVVDIALLELLRHIREQHTATLWVGAAAEHRGRIDIGKLRT